MTYQVTYIEPNTYRKPILQMKIGAKSMDAAKAYAKSYHQKHLRAYSKIQMVVSEV